MIYDQNTEQNSPKYSIRFPNKTVGNPNLNAPLVYAHPVETRLSLSRNLVVTTVT